MKLTIWEGIKLGASLITAFLVGLMLVVYLIDYENYTLLVPDDEAFAGIEPDLKIKILSDKELA